LCCPHPSGMSVVQKKDLTGAVLGLGAWPQVQHHDSARPLLPHRLVEPCTQKFPKAPLHGGNDRARTASHAQPLRPRTCRRQSRWHHRTRRLRSGRRGPCQQSVVACCWLCSAGTCGGFGSALRKYAANMRRLLGPWRALHWRRLPQCLPRRRAPAHIHRA